MALREMRGTAGKGGDCAEYKCANQVLSVQYLEPFPRGDSPPIEGAESGRRVDTTQMSTNKGKPLPPPPPPPDTDTAGEIKKSLELRIVEYIIRKVKFLKGA